MAEQPQASSADLGLLPAVSFTFVETIVKDSMKSSGVKEHTRGYKYFAEKYMTGIKLYSDSQEGCLVKAKCHRSMKKNEAPHDIQVLIKPGPSLDRSLTKCSCAIGECGMCGHICGLLYTLAHLKTSGCKTIPSDVAKTSLPQTWHQPRGEKLAASTSDETIVMGYNSRDPTKPTRGIKTTLYNPISSSTIFPSLNTLFSRIETIDPSCLFLTIGDLDQSTEIVSTKFGPFAKQSTIGIQHKLSGNYVLNILDSEPYPNLPVRNVMTPSLLFCLDQKKSTSFESLQVTEQESHSIEEMSRMQSLDPKWHAVRKDRLTASIAGDIIKRRADFGTLVTRLRTTRRVVTESMRHGIASEPIAAQLYCQVMDQNVNIYPSGVVISPYASYIAASPDRKMYCPMRLPAYGLLEVKCPVLTLPECKYLSRQGTVYRLKRNHNYFYQIMTQLADTRLVWCDFFVYAPDGHHLETIYFDQVEWDKMKEKLDICFVVYFLQ